MCQLIGTGKNGSDIGSYTNEKKCAAVEKKTLIRAVNNVSLKYQKTKPISTPTLVCDISN